MRLRHWPVNEIHLYIQPVDFRKSIDGLTAIVEMELELNPFQPALFVFSNRKRDKVKILYWERTGFVLWYKRLEQQRFQWPKQLTTLTAEQLSWLLDGLNIEAMQPHSTLQFDSVFTN